MSNEKRPNILFVFSDQQRYSALGANGNDVIKTPVLDAMADEGMVCDNMFSNHPLCSPYRAILLTGRYGWQNLVIDNEYSPRRDIPTLPGTLREHGYGTAHVGTWHLGKGHTATTIGTGWIILRRWQEGEGGAPTSTDPITKMMRVRTFTRAGLQRTKRIWLFNL